MTLAIWGHMVISLVHALHVSLAGIRMHAVCQNVSYAPRIRIRQNEGAALALIVQSVRAGPQPMVLRATLMSLVVFVGPTSFWIRPRATALPARLRSQIVNKLGLRWLL